MTNDPLSIPDFLNRSKGAAIMDDQATEQEPQTAPTEGNETSPAATEQEQTFAEVGVRLDALIAKRASATASIDRAIEEHSAILIKMSKKVRK